MRKHNCLKLQCFYLHNEYCPNILKQILHLLEDEGFALKCWDNIRYEDRNIVILDNYAFAMGNYFFKSSNTDNEIKVEYTFGYIKKNVQHLVINLHHSSLPFKK